MSTPKAIRLMLLVSGVAGLLLFVSLLIVLRSTGNPANATSGLAISTAGFTNAPGGTRLALFSISNAVSREIAYSAAIEVKEGNIWQPPPWRTPPITKVTAHQFSMCAVTNPIEGTWRVSILYQMTPTKGDELGLGVRRFLDRLKLYSVAKWVPTERFKAYTVSGPEMTD